ncbi:E6A protein [Equid gammaherpesvirus 2]|nr:E6A protein [Equid gammaherpesvirus 2]
MTGKSLHVFLLGLLLLMLWQSLQGEMQGSDTSFFGALTANESAALTRNLSQESATTVSPAPACAGKSLTKNSFSSARMCWQKFDKKYYLHWLFMGLLLLLLLLLQGMQKIVPKMGDKIKWFGGFKLWSGIWERRKTQDR